MNRSPADPKARSFRSLLGATAVVLVVVLLAAGLRSYKDLSAQRARDAALKRRIAETNERIQELERRIELLATDPGTLERVAREELGMVKPGDVVVKLTTTETDETSVGGVQRMERGDPGRVTPRLGPGS